MDSYITEDGYNTDFYVEDIKVGKTDEDGNVKISYKIDNGIVNAIYYEKLTVRNGKPALEYDHCEIKGIDIIGDWSGSWSFLSGINISIDSYDSETGTFSGRGSHALEGVDLEGILNNQAGTMSFWAVEGETKYKLTYNPYEQGFELLEETNLGFGEAGSVLRKVQSE